MTITHHALDHFGGHVLHRTGARVLLSRAGLPKALTEPLPSDSAEVPHLAPEGRGLEQLGDLGGVRRPRFRPSPGQADAVQRAGRADCTADASAEAVQGVVSTVHDFPAASIGVRRFWPARTAAARLPGILDSPDSGCRAVGQSSRVST